MVALPFLRQSTDLLRSLHLQKAGDRRFARRVGLLSRPHRTHTRRLEKTLSDKGRIPFILYPNLCAKCGTLWPEMFPVPDAEWKHYIEPRMRREMFVPGVLQQIKRGIDGEGLGLTRRSKQTKEAPLCVGLRPGPGAATIKGSGSWMRQCCFCKRGSNCSIQPPKCHPHFSLASRSAMPAGPWLLGGHAHPLVFAPLGLVQ